MAVAIMLAMPAMAQARGAEVSMGVQMRFDIAASDLRSAISQFSQATGVQVVVAPNVVAGRRTGGEVPRIGPRSLAGLGKCLYRGFRSFAHLATVPQDV
ncbi:MAG: hypothetical protein IH998_12140 [Proteobacteria bacterium]|nr:hypothetical protein [Pseudomonadota bacterium]